MEENMLVKKSKSNITKITSLFLAIGLFIMLIGISYAYFVYYKTGLYNYTINGGKMNVIYSETTGNNIQIDNAYPISDKKAETKAIDFEFTITGYNESEENIYYAIEIDYGSENASRTRFKDSDMKLSLYENGNEVFKNEIFHNLKKQGIYYGYIRYGTSQENPTINNYKLKLWINDNVFINNALDDDIALWDDYDWNWANNNLDYDNLNRIYDNKITKLSELGISIYKPEEFANRYVSYKVNVNANMSGKDIGIIVYDANGGEFEPIATSIATNKITSQKPVLEGKGFLGWSDEKNATDVKYYAGDYYSGNATTLYAVYNEKRNVMGSFSDNILEYVGEKEVIEDEQSWDLQYDYSVNQLRDSISTTGSGIKEIYFINDLQSKIDERYAMAEVKADITYNNQGNVKAWLENIDEYGNYILYIGAEGTIYFSQCVSLFSPFINCKYINLENVDSSMIVDMTNMFRFEDLNDGGLMSNNDDIHNSIIKPIGSMNTDEYIKIEHLSSLNTSNVLKMTSMFENLKCVELDIKNFDTSQVEDMSYMFSGCYALYDLDLKKINTTNVINMAGLFKNCYNLKNINLETLDTSKVRDMSYMFSGCAQIMELDLLKFNTSNVENMSNMFYDCYYVEDLDVTSFDTTNVIDMSYMFGNLSNIKSLDLSKFNTSKVENMSGMFAWCTSINRLDITSFSTVNVIDMSYMFERCDSLDSIDLSHFDMKNVISTASMFYRTPIKKINLSNKDLSKITDMSYMFYETLLEDVNMSNCIYNENIDITMMFGKCKKLINLNFSNCVNLFEAVFSCASSDSPFNSIKYLNYSGSVFSSSVTSLYMGFALCRDLITADFSNVNFNKITDLTCMFLRCPSLKEVNFAGTIMPEVMDMTCMFEESLNLINVDFVNCEMKKVMDMTQIFRGCTRLESVDLSSFEFSNLLNHSGIFTNVGIIVYVKNQIEQNWLITNYSYFFDTSNAIIKNT